MLMVGVGLLAGAVHLTIPLAPWVALILMLQASRSLPAFAAAPCLWLASMAVLAITERASIPATGPAYLAVVASAALTMTLPFAIDRVVDARAFGSTGIASTLTFPIAFVATDFLRSRVLPSATWGSIAYTQYGVASLMQVAAFVGIWGIVFLIAWSASTFAVAWQHGFASSSARGPLLAFTVTFFLAIIVGMIRIATAPTDRPVMRVAALNRPADLFAPGEITRITEARVTPADRPSIDAKLAKLHDWFLNGSRREARAGARLVVWPEQSLLVFSEHEAGFLARAQRVAADERAYLAMGMGTIHLGETRPFENKLVLVDPSGRITVSYAKTHPVPGWEASIMRRGDGRLPVAATPDGRMATAICYDSSFPEFIRQAAAGMADLLILPVNDWKVIRAAHFQMDAFRAIESGVPIVRAAASGISGVFDPWGRVVAVADYFAPGDRTLTAQLPVGGVRTLYARTGDLFAWLCVAGLVVVLAVAVAAYVQPRSESATNGAAPLIHPPIARGGR
jgi:apolipoprotein N-acyltransferase